MGGFEADVVLADGGGAHVRLRRDSDDAQMEALYRRLSDRGRYRRFFAPTTAESAARLERTTAELPSRCTVVATIGDDIVAAAEYDVGDAEDVAEVAFTVQDDQQGRGLGTSLLEMLARVAIAHGIRRFTAAFLTENTEMREVFARAGFDVHWRPEPRGLVEVTLDLEANASWTSAHRQREHTAERRSIAALLSPSSIAVVGVGRRDNSIGRAVAENLLASGFEGPVYVVNRHPTTVRDLESYPSVAALPRAPSLAVLTVPASEVLDAARDCARAGVQNLVVISGGFAELPGGSELQTELVALCRGAGMRVVGPNCIGVVNTDPAVRMNATFSPVSPERGRIGFASQSGGVGIELLARARELGLGVSSFVSLGNKADVSGNDLLQYWADDPSTDVVLLYLESFGNPRKFARLAREVARQKPIVAMKSGRTSAGARGARSHTAALADSDDVIDVLLQENGVIRVDTLEELFDTASLLARMPVPRGRRVAVMSNGGGPGIIAADACISVGLEVPELSAVLQQALGAAAAPGAGVKNPVDLIASADAEAFLHAGRALLASDEIDALIVLYVAPRVTKPAQIARAVEELARGCGDKPVVACFLGLGRRGRIGSPQSTVPTFAFPESAARAVGRAARLGEWRGRPSGVEMPLGGLDEERARELVAGVLATRPEGGWAQAQEAHELLSCYGVPTVVTRRARDAREAVAAADELGYPVVLKAASPELVHKSDVGGVDLDLRSPSAVHDAFVRMTEALGPAMGGALVQPMVPRGVELIVGITRHDRFGPLVAFGLGGFAAELQRDVVLRVPPLTDVDIEAMLNGLRGSPLLFGYRGSPAVDVAALRQLLARMGRLAADLPEVADLDCNPVVASSAGAVVVDAKLRIAPDLHPRSVFDVD